MEIRHDSSESYVYQTLNIKKLAEYLLRLKNKHLGKETPFTLVGKSGQQEIKFENISELTIYLDKGKALDSVDFFSWGTNDLKIGASVNLMEKSIYIWARTDENGENWISRVEKTFKLKRLNATKSQHASAEREITRIENEFERKKKFSMTNPIVYGVVSLIVIVLGAIIISWLNLK